MMQASNEHKHSNNNNNKQPRAARSGSNGSALMLLLLMVLACSLATLIDAQQQRPLNYGLINQRLVSRRAAASSSHPLARADDIDSVDADTHETPVVVGRFQAPAPGKILRQVLGRGASGATQTVSASFRVAERDSSLPEKIVHGVNGERRSNKRQAAANNQRVVSAKFQVSDEGLNYPPSKLSADIYGNVAEIVTAPPEAVEQDFLIPTNNKLFPRRAN